jgi:outer membrane lipopolysaccharide assembly protein LptE/RlpB
MVLHFMARASSVARNATISVDRMTHSANARLRRLKSLTLIFALLSLAASGCGYHTVGPATHLPPGTRTIDVPIFATRVQNYSTEVEFTKAIVREIDTRTKLRVLTGADADADAHLSGTILTQSIAPLTYDSTSGQTASYLVTITAKVVLTARDGRILYQNDALPFREQYQSTQDLNGFIQEDGPAVHRLAQDFARTIVSNMLESF